jgi:3'-phosphoadenosine 5'-phosphosulfate sulfotransferase (PAPS reductase)/FAD synthetase
MRGFKRELSNKNRNSFENKYTSDDLKIMQSWNLNRKIQVTQTRIIEWYERNKGNVYVSFSGGKDSTVLLYLVRQIYPNVPAVFVDTGLEYPEIREFVKTIPNVIWLKPEMNFRQVISTYGYPLISKETALNIYYARKAKERGDIEQYNHYVYGQRTNPKTGEKYSFMSLSKLAIKLLESDIPVHNKCCTIMKKNPTKLYEKKTGKRAYVGTMACESKLRKIAWLKNGCNAFDSKRPISQPLAFWTEQDVLEFLTKYNLDFASIYGNVVCKDGFYCTTGVDRTGCMFCGFGCHLEKEPNRFQKLKVSHPKIWEYIMKPYDKGGLGFKDVLNFIGVATE